MKNAPNKFKPIKLLNVELFIKSNNLRISMQMLKMISLDAQTWSSFSVQCTSGASSKQAGRQAGSRQASLLTIV